MADDRRKVRVRRISYEADNVNSYELVLPDGGDLAPFSAGSHIDLHLQNGMIRSYSLVNNQGEKHRYVIAVNKDPSSRGGSSFVHDGIKVGDIITISAPRNNFALREDAEFSVLIAGGIGITPLMSMIRRLEELARPWKLFYAARTQRAAAFLDDLHGIRPENLQMDFDDERMGKVFDIAAVVANQPEHAHLYCCGPAPMLEAFERASASRPSDHVHVEYFQAKQAPALDGGFEVKLRRSNRTVAVETGKSILDAVLDAGISANYSCTEGVCGTCETRVIEGIPDHRDLFLSPEEKAANKTIMICCSGSKSGTLVLDL
jgi:ferredoxin-NADP reductase